jgi:ribosomal protein S18 acetylase RimI-like enzyme
MEIKTLESLPLSAIAETFNKSFSDYSLPISYTDEQFKNKVIAEGIDLRFSSGAFINNELVGFILNGIDTINGSKLVFNAGTGVVPQQRGKFIVGKLYDYILPVLAEQGFRYHQLEVVEGNEKAEKIYAGKGFSRTRKLTAFKGIVKSAGKNDVTVTVVPSLNWAEAESFWNVKPTWQNNTQCILRAPLMHKILKAEVDGVFAGYAVADVSSGRLKQFAVKKEYRRRGIGTALFKHAANERDEVSFINFDVSDAGSLAFFKALGLEPVVNLYEMTMQHTEVENTTFV